MKTIYITLLAVIMGMSSPAQNNKKQDRIKSLKIAHITEDLKLTQIEAQNFWPIYNAYEVKKSDLKKTTRKIREQLDMQTINEADARTVISDMITSEREQHDLKSKLMSGKPTIVTLILMFTKPKFGFLDSPFQHFVNPFPNSV